MRARRRTLVALLLALAGGADARLSGQAFPAPPSPEVTAEVRRALDAMKADERGPFARIRWYCADGSVLAPQGTPCRERGGGVQHAEHSAAARRLAELGYDVGTILQSMDYAAFRDSARAGYRLREIVLERFLMDVDDGWVMRRARYYRGALQVEDEERQGAAFLARLLGTPGWTRANYLLSMRLAAVVPHPRLGDGRAIDRIRSLATEIAAEDPGFMRLRVKIHSVPSRDDLDSVIRYLARGGHPESVRPRLESLRDALRAHYEPARALAALSAYESRVGEPLRGELRALGETLRRGSPAASVAALADVAVTVRRAAETTADGGRVVDLLDLQASLQERAFVLALEWEAASAESTRDAALTRVGRYAQLAHGAGYLSGRELEAFQGEVARIRGSGRLTALSYKESLGYLGRGLDWARGTVRGTFGPVLDVWAPVEPRSSGLVDDLLRSSALLPLSRALDRLQADADVALGASHSLLGESLAGGVRGLNPGAAIGPLHVLEHPEDEVDARTIYVLPETPPELEPVAGVLTLDEGNLLSHVQLLARNLGIPNAAASPELLDRFRTVEGQEVFYAVTPLGRVVVKRPDALTEAERALMPSDQPRSAERYPLDTSRLRLDRVAPIPLTELRASLSGVVVGPKAANLGQLAADFPGRVSRAAALPFGMFVRHADRPYGGSEGTVLDELRAAYARAAEMRAGGASDAEVDRMMIERLAWVREAIQELPWIPELETLVVEALTATLGGDVQRGVFVRSDTNVEDLPQFSGAGLNLTVAHQTSVADVLASVKRVWTSPFTERAYRWRSQILEDQGAVYPSVLLQESVPSAKSGVLITSGLQDGGPDDITVVVAEGVGGGVEGEEAETLVLGADGSVRLLSQAKTPRRRELTRGGTRWVAAELPDTLVRPGELAQVREVVARWKELMAGTPDADRIWDMEFGFVDGRLWLFQVRPFIRYRNSDVQARLEALDADVMRNADRPIRLAQPLEGS